jgi:hypothetical protein
MQKAAASSTSSDPSNGRGKSEISPAFLTEHVLAYTAALWSPRLGDRTEERAGRFLAVSGIALLWAAGLVGETAIDKSTMTIIGVELHGTAFCITAVAAFLVSYTFVMWGVSAKMDWRRWSIEVGSKKIPMFKHATSQIKQRNEMWAAIWQDRPELQQEIAALSAQADKLNKEMSGLLVDGDAQGDHAAWKAKYDDLQERRDAIERELEQKRGLDVSLDTFQVALQSLTDRSPEYLSKNVKEFARFSRFWVSSEVCPVFLLFLVTAVVLIWRLYILWPRALCPK